MKSYQKIVPHSIIILYILMMIKTHLPMDKVLFRSLYYPVDKIQSFLGINQTWMMFSPNPSRTDSLVVGEVEYSDGTKAVFDFLKKTDSLSYKYLRGEKIRKYISENLRQDSNSYLWNDAADFVLKNVSQDGRLPVKVSLKRLWSETPDWHESFIKHSEKKTSYQSHVFFSRKVE